METQVAVPEQPKHPGGRPPIYTEETVRQIIGALQLGLSVTTVCDVAGISRDTYYNWLKEKEEFFDKVTKAQHHATILAANIVGDVLQDSLRGKIDTKSGKHVPYKYGEQTRVNTAKWLLEKKERQGFGSQTIVGAKVESDGKGGQTATVIYATDESIDKLLDQLGNSPTEEITGQFAEPDGHTEADSEVSTGASEDSQRQLSEVSAPSTQETDMAGGGDQGGTPPVHTGELPHEHSENESMS